MKLLSFFILNFLALHSFCLFAQNPIEVIPIDCSKDNGFTMFLLDRVQPKILTKHHKEQKEKTWDHKKMIIVNDSEVLKIQFTNIFGQTIDTTFTNARKISTIKLCVSTFIDYQKESVIEEVIKEEEKWILNSFWGQQTVESDKLILKPKEDYLQYKYYRNRNLIKRGKIPLTKAVIERIALFERKLYLLQETDNSCNFVVSYQLKNGEQKIRFQDYSCSGFTNEQFLTDLDIK